jgi:hypothetical protein
MAEHEQKEHGSVESLLQVGNTGASIPVDGGMKERTSTVVLQRNWRYLKWLHFKARLRW